jgi:hypothetical protein
MTLMLTQLLAFPFPTHNEPVENPPHLPLAFVLYRKPVFSKNGQPLQSFLLNLQPTLKIA